MNYTTDYTVILTAIYILFIAIAYAPKTCKVSPATKIEYFPEIDDEPYIKTETVFTETDEPAPIGPVVSTAIATEPAKNALINPVNDLTRLTIRELKKLASGRIKNYSNLTKKELVLALS